jgi:hypothetical protein
MAAFAALMFYIPRASARSLLLSLVRAGDNRVFYRFDAEGVTIRAAGSTSSFAYRTVIRSRETGTAFLLYATPEVASIVPKRAFAAGDLERVRALLGSQVPRQTARGQAGRFVLLWLGLIVVFFVIWQFMSLRGR